MTLDIPPALDHLRRVREGAAWLADLPGTIERAIDRWSLELGSVYADGGSAWVAAVIWQGEPAVLRIQWPGGNRYQVAALRAWGGEGAVRVLATAEEDRVCLLERCSPGTYLADRDPREVLEVFAELVPRHWKRPEVVFPRVARQVTEDIEGYQRRRPRVDSLDRSVIERAFSIASDLVRTETEPVLVNDDLHPWNVLRAEREPWLVIDPAPCSGEREYGLAAIIRCPELGNTREEVLHRLSFLCAELGLDRERARGWALYAAVARAIQPGARSHLAEVTRWLADDSG